MERVGEQTRFEHFDFLGLLVIWRGSEGLGTYTKKALERIVNDAHIFDRIQR